MIMLDNCERVKTADISFKALSNSLAIAVHLKENSDSFTCVQILSTQARGGSHG